MGDMNEEAQKRRYQMSKRADAFAQTAKDIFDATTGLWHEHPIADITLEAVAQRAGVSVRTIIRRYGSKEGLFEACIQNYATDMEANRDRARPGDVEAAIHGLLQDYEAHGDAMIRTLAVEAQLDIACQVLKVGRRHHRCWCERMFAPHLPDQESADYEPLLRAFVAATDLYLWKLLRRDLKQTLNETQDTLMKLVKGLIVTHQGQK